MASLLRPSGRAVNIQHRGGARRGPRSPGPGHPAAARRSRPRLTAAGFDRSHPMYRREPRVRGAVPWPGAPGTPSTGARGRTGRAATPGVAGPPRSYLGRVDSHLGAADDTASMRGGVLVSLTLAALALASPARGPRAGSRGAAGGGG